MSASIDKNKLELCEWGKGQRILEKPRLLKGKKVKQIACGGSHSAALLEDGKVYIWGDGRSGQLGLGPDEKTVELPTLITGLEPVTQIWCGFAQTAVYTEKNRLFMWGFDPFEGPIFTPKNIREFDKIRISEITFGPTTTYALILRQNYRDKTSSTFVGLSEVRVWGISNQGMLGLGSDKTTQRTPTTIPYLADKNVIKLSVGEFHVAACTSKGGIYVWGLNKDKTLGTGKDGILFIPTPVPTLHSQYISNVLCGTNFTLAMTGDGALYSWGMGRHGVMGLGNENDVELPSRVNIERIVGFATGGLHVVCWTEDGTVYSWGYGRGFKLGQSHENDIFHPSIIETITKKKFVVDIKCGFYTTLAFLEMDILTICYENQIRSIPVTQDMTFLDVLEKMSKLHGMQMNEFYLIDDHGNDYPNDTLIRKKRLEHGNRLNLLRKRRLSEESSSDLVLAKDLNDEFPVVLKGTVNKLTEWLTFHFNTGPDFKRVFENMYPNFVSSEDLLENLKERYLEPQMPVGIHQSMSGGITRVAQLKVLAFIKNWLDHNDLFDQLNVIEDLNTFIEEHVMDKYPYEATNIRKVLIDKFEQFESLEEFSSWGNYTYPLDTALPATLPQHSNDIDVFKYLPIEIARQLTIIDYYDFFIKIKPKELFNQNWARKDKETQSPNIIQMIKRFNNISEWVAAEILRAETKEIRVKKAEVFIEVADSCMKLNNLNAVTSIISSFNSSPIYRLKSIWESPGISIKHKQMIEELRSLVSLSMNMSKYREHITNIKPPLIPFIGIHLQDYTFLDDANPSYYDDKKKIVNFSKWNKLDQIITLIKRFQTIPYILTPIKPLIKYLLQACGFQNHEISAYRFSTLIEPIAGSVNEEVAIIPPPTLFSESISKIYHLHSGSNTDGNQIRYLNQRVEIILGKKHHDNLMEERVKLWRMINSKLQATPKNKEIDTFRRSPSIVNDIRKEKFNFNEIVVRSNTIELSIESALEEFPHDNQDVLLELLSHCLYPCVDCKELLNVIKELSNCRLVKQQRETISLMVGAYKNYSKTFRDLTLKMTEKSLERRLTISQNMALPSSDNNPTDTLILHHIDQINNSAEFVKEYNTQQKYLIQILEEYNDSLCKMENDSFYELSSSLSDLKRQISLYIDNIELKKDELFGKYSEEKEDIFMKIQEESDRLHQFQDEERLLENQLVELNLLIEAEEQNINYLEYLDAKDSFELQREIEDLQKKIAEEEQNRSLTIMMYPKFIDCYFSASSVIRTLVVDLSSQIIHNETQELQQIVYHNNKNTQSYLKIVEEQLQLQTFIQSYLTQAIETRMQCKSSIEGLPNHPSLPDVVRLEDERRYNRAISDYLKSLGSYYEQFYLLIDKNNIKLATDSLRLNEAHLKSVSLLGELKTIKLK